MAHTRLTLHSSLRHTAIVTLMLMVGNICATAYDFTVDGIYYNILPATESAEVTYATNTYNSYSGQVTIPAKVKNGNKTYNVTEVGDNAFRDCTELNAIVLGENVVTIGKRAFTNCSQLISVNITKSVTLINDYAFAQCYALTSVNMNNDSPLEIGTGAFMRCSALNNITWESSGALDGRGGLYRLGTNAFAQCSSLTSIILPGSLQMLGITIFDGCTQLHNVTVMSETPTSVNSDPFSLDHALTTIYVPSSGQQGVTQALYKKATGWKDYNISELPYSFFDNDGYTYLKTSSTTVALYGCNTSKDNVVVRYSITDYNNKIYLVTSIADEAFKSSAIKTFDSTKALKLKTIGSECFANCNQLTQASIIEGITTMGHRTFANCTSLSSIEIPSTLRTIPYAAFDGCTSLNNISLVMGVATISEDAFANCTSLTSINLPRSLMKVEHNAFMGNTSLQQINVDPRCMQYASFEGVLFEMKYGEDFERFEYDETNKLVLYPQSKPEENFYIPCGTTSIEDNAIENAAYLKHLAIPNTTTQFGNDCFKGTNLEIINYRNSKPTEVTTNALNASLKANTLLQVPVGAINAFKENSSWTGFKNIEERYDVFHNDQFAYDWNTRFEMTIVDIKSAAVDANGTVNFFQDLSLSGYTYNITELGNTATTNVSQLVKTLNFNNDSLAIINTSNDINPIAALESLQEIIVSDNNPYFKVADDILYNKYGNVIYYYLHTKTNQQFTIPNEIDSIKPQAFAKAPYLQIITFNQRLRSIGGRAFEDCPLLQQINSANNVSTLGDRAFANCINLTTFNGGERLNTIGNETFLNCEKLTYVPLSHGMIKKIGNRAFKGCKALEALVTSKTLSNVGDGAFEDCSSLNKVFFTSKISLGQQVFKGCSSLSELWMCNNTPPEVGNNFFDQSSIASTKIFVPQEAVSLYQAKTPWNSVAQINPSYHIDNGADVNNDNAITSLDVTMIYSALLGEVDDQIDANFDVNRDGSVTSADVTLVYDNILTGKEVTLAYMFMQSNNNGINHYISLSQSHQLIVAIDKDTNQPVTNGLMGVIDNNIVAHITLGNSQGVPYLEIVPTALGYCSLAAIVLNNDGTYFYRTYPLLVQP